jgi:hypothetical protein
LCARQGAPTRRNDSTALGDNWKVGASLPNSLRVGLGDSVSIELDTDKPYTHHEEHMKKVFTEKSQLQYTKGKETDLKISIYLIKAGPAVTLLLVKLESIDTMRFKPKVMYKV